MTERKAKAKAEATGNRQQATAKARMQGSLRCGGKNAAFGRDDGWSFLDRF
jgi:hypothetical protein